MRVRNSRRELAHELAEVDAAVGGEVEDQLRAVERLLDPRELHAEPALADLQQRDAIRLLLAVLVLEARDDVVAGGEADDPLRRIGRRPPLRLELRNPAHDGAEAVPPSVWTTTRSPGLRHGLPWELVEQERLRPADGRQLDVDERQADGRAHSCNTSQSATSLTPALRSSATSARSTAPNARTPRSPRYVSVSRSSAGRTSGLASVRSSARVASSFDVAQQRRHGAQVRRQLFALAVAAGAGFRQQFLGAFEPPRRVVARGRVREHPLGDAARLDQLSRARLAAPGRGCRRPWRRPRALRSRCVRARPAPTRCRRPTADGSAAADSARAPSAAARRAGPSRG